MPVLVGAVNPDSAAPVVPPPPPAIVAPAPAPAPQPAPPQPAPAPEPPPDALVPPGIVRPPETSPSVTLIPAPPAVQPDATVPPVTPPQPQPTGGDTGADVAGETQLLPTEDGPDPDATEFFSLDATGGTVFVARLRKYAALYNIDPLAAAANAMEEGIHGGIGDDGTAYGPWQIHATDGRIRNFRNRPKNDPAVNAWAWSDDGVAYAFRSMVAAGADGLTGHDAVARIVNYFEKPANKAGAVVQRNDVYDALKGAGANAWQIVATNAKGPDSGSGSPTVPNVTAAPSVGAQTQWRGLLSVFRDTVPLQAQYAEAVADSIKDVG